MSQKCVFEAALRKLKQTGGTETRTSKNSPVTTKSLAKNGDLEEILRKIEGTGPLEDSLLALNRLGKSQATLNSSTLS